MYCVEDRPDLSQVESDSAELWMGACDLTREITLSGANVDERPICRPREFRGNGEVRSMADAGHGFEKLLEPRRVGVERGEH